MQTVSLSVFRFGPPTARLWALAQMGAARLSLGAMPEAGFWKLFGTGTGEGFTPAPNTAVWAILATWPDEAAARRSIATAPLFQRWRRWSEEGWTVLLSAFSSRGRWAGASPFAAQGAPPEGPIAVLTRASIKPSRALRFWGRAPAISDAIGANADVLFKIGLGETPGLRQVTFSIWPDARSMTAFARAEGPHARAVRAVREGDWFSEELYARFRVVGEIGTWGGVSPLSRPESPKDAA